MQSMTDLPSNTVPPRTSVHPGRTGPGEAGFLRWRGAMLSAAAGMVLAFAWGRPGIEMPPCSFAARTHLPCPTCGMTRSLRCAARGELGAAFGHHAFGPVLLGAAVAACGIGAVELVGGRDVWRRLRVRWWWAAIGAAGLLAGWGWNLLGALGGERWPVG